MNTNISDYESFLAFKNSFLFKIFFYSLLFIIISLLISFYKLSGFSKGFEKEMFLPSTIDRNIENNVSIFDPLTHSYNHEYFMLRFDEEFKRAMRDEVDISLLMIDINEFYAYEELYGKKEADNCLIKIATCLKKQCSRPADMVFRIEGDVFYLLLPNTKHSAIFALKCRDAVDSLCLAHDNSLRTNMVRISYGAANIKVKNISSKIELFNKCKESLKKNKEKKLQNLK